MKKIFTLLLVCILIFSLTACKETGNVGNDAEEKLYIGYVSLDGNTLKLDEFEFLTQENPDRLEELGISVNDMPNGYYIYNESEEITSLTIDQNTEFTFFDTGNLFVSEEDDKRYTTKDIEKFRTFLYGDDDIPAIMPFWVKVQGDKVISVEEQFVV